MNVKLAFKILRQAPPGWLGQRLRLAAQARTGALKRAMPIAAWEKYTVAGAVAAFRVFPRLPQIASAPREAENILRGRFRFFSGQSFDLTFPPDWRLNPFTGARADSNAHWSVVPWDAAGDIKCVWELSRFAWVFPLLRAYAATRDERFAEGFWRLFEDFCQKNPPNSGIQWKCGQETALRMIHVCIAADAMRDAAASTPARQTFVATFVNASAERIAGHIDYALSQRNNHSISEAVGLFTAGTMFPRLPNAAKWRQQGGALLEKLAFEQIYADGSYLQHSFNYQRFSLSLLLWAHHVDALNGAMLPARFRERTLCCAEMMTSFIDPETGRMPNTGGNDGALLFSLNGCEYEDFRPAVQWACGKLAGRREFPAGPWDETAQWFDVQLPGDAQPVAPTSAPAGGHLHLAGIRSWGMLRCAHYKDRPFQADQLHLDIFHNGKPVALDPGTYAYNPQPPDDWDNPLTSAAVHNTVTVDGAEPMVRAGRFLWLDWAQGTVIEQSAGTIVAEHDGYQPVIHRRTVKVEDDRWTVTDELQGSGQHQFELHWLMADGDVQLQGNQVRIGNVQIRIETSAECALRLLREGKRTAGAGEAAADRYRGWYAPTYRVRVPAISVVASMSAQLPARFITQIQMHG